MKGQTLPWVAINVVGMIMFVIILVSILSMQKNFYMTVKELDKRTALMQMGREFLTSPNCVTYEFTDYTYLNSTRRVKLIDIVKPGIVDPYKYMDFYHFNCMRFDFKHVEDNGMTMAYAAKLKDVNTGRIINPPIITHRAYGRIINPPITSIWPPNGTIYSFESGTNQFDKCIITNSGLINIIFKSDYPPNCTDRLYQIQPVLIKNGNNLDLGILYFSICEDKSKNYKGTKFCEQNIK